MPTNVVKTPADEEKWQKAKARAKEQGKGGNYAYIMGIYKQMNPDKFKSAQRVAARYAALLPLMDPLYNLREAAKELLLLEDHLGHAQKHCPDCIRKHLLTTEALLEEAVRLDTEGEMLGLLSPLPARVRELWTAYQDGRPEHEIGQAARVLRKGLVEASADVRVAARKVAARYAASSPDMGALSRAIDDLSDGLADIMDHHALQWRDTPGLAKANSNIMHALMGYQSELEKFYSQEHARLEKEREQERERLERERVERARQEKERQKKKERQDTLKKLERLAARVFKDWHTDTTGVGGEWLLTSYWDTEGKTAYDTAEQAVESFIDQARKLVGGAPSFQSREEKPSEGTLRGSLKNSRMFNIQIRGQAYLDIDGSSMADLTVAVEPKE